MDPISTFILTQVADTIIGTITDDGTQELISKLQGDPTKKALKKALGEALTRYVESQPERKVIAKPLLRRKSLLAEKDIADELAQVVKFIREPNTILIGRRWRDELDNPPAWRDFTSEAKLLIDYFTDELKATSTFAPVFEVASLDSIAVHTEISSESLASVEKSLGLLLSLMDSQFGTLAQTIAGASIGISEQIRDFSPYMAEKTGGFIGRYFLFQEIQAFINSHPRGYFLLHGDPGIGKSAISAKLVKDHGYIHHFNISADGINKASDFLRNICAQLIAVYSLDYTSLPPETTRDSGFLNQLLNAISKKMGQSEKCVIVVDALDEAEDLSPQSGANILFLPRTLPQGIFIIATSRREPEERMRLRIDIPEQVKRVLKQDESGNCADITEYLQGQVSNSGIQAYISRHQIDEELFIGHMVDKAQGNFMYLRYVLPEIERGAYTHLELEHIPAGLKNYYEDHWRRVRRQNEIDWDNYKLPVVATLTIAKEPISLHDLAHYSGVNSSKVEDILNDFNQFIYEIAVEHQGMRELRFRWYHASFFQFIAAKRVVAEERVNLKQAHEKVADRIWNDLFGDDTT